MARAHWRYVVRDEDGHCIQNALVYVYQQGTTTNFSGNAYDASSAGNALTNPFTTNEQGEAEGWFDQGQIIDVLVTDNSNTAYRAGEAASAVISFDSFTETDQVIGPALIGDISAALVNPFTAVTGVIGTTGRYADAAHVHPFTALTPAAPVRPRTISGAGTLLNPAREDHIHPFVANLGLTAKQTKTTAAEEVIGNALTVAASTVAAGSMFRLSMYGYETNGTTAITFTFRVRWGGLAGVVIGQALAIAGTTTAHTDNPMQLEFLMTIQAIGSGTSGSATGSWFGAETLTSTTANTPKLVLDVQNAGAGIDTTANKDLVMTLQLSATTNGPQLEVDNLSIVQVA